MLRKGKSCGSWRKPAAAYAYVRAVAYVRQLALRAPQRPCAESFTMAAQMQQHRNHATCRVMVLPSAPDCLSVAPRGRLQLQRAAVPPGDTYKARTWSCLRLRAAAAPSTPRVTWIDSTRPCLGPAWQAFIHPCEHPHGFGSQDAAPEPRRGTGSSSSCTRSLHGHACRGASIPFPPSFHTTREQGAASRRMCTP